MVVPPIKNRTKWPPQGKPAHVDSDEEVCWSKPGGKLVADARTGNSISGLVTGPVNMAGFVEVNMVELVPLDGSLDSYFFCDDGVLGSLEFDPRKRVG